MLQKDVPAISRMLRLFRSLWVVRMVKTGRKQGKNQWGVVVCTCMTHQLLENIDALQEPPQVI